MTNENDSETSFSTILTMSQYTPKERAEIVAFYIENNRSYSEMLANVMQNAQKRAAFCVSNGGGHLIDVVF